jgi:hypothetical protein
MALTQEQSWLPNPDKGTLICAGMDGSDNNDWTAIRAETIDGLQFTPRYGPDRRPMVWNPAEWNGQIPRSEVYAAVDELFAVYGVARMYCDPHDWYSDIGDWSLKYGEDHVFEWPTNQPNRMYPEIRRFEVDLAEGRITHDGCPLAAVHFANARKKARPGQKYTLDKPTDHQKIDIVMSSILAHTAASDARADGWGEQTDNRMWCF